MSVYKQAAISRDASQGGERERERERGRERERERRSGVICKLIGSASRMELLSSRLFLLQRPLLFHKPQMPFRVYIGLMGGCASCGGVWVTG